MDYDKIEQYSETIEECNKLMTSNSNAEIEPMEEVINGNNEHNPAVDKHLNSDFGSWPEQELKKILAAAAIASNDEGSPDTIAARADASAVSIKAAYKVSTGELDITDSAEVLMDQATARLNAFIQDKLDMDFIGDKIVDMVACSFPPANTLRPYVKVVLKKVEPVVRKVIHSGIKAMANHAKQTVRNISTTVKKLTKTLFA